MTLSAYVKRRNGVPFGHPRSLQNNLQRALGAANFPGFWNFWNPVFGYYLGIKVFRPLKKIFPVIWSLVLTFAFCGLVHDAVTTLIRGKISLLFTVWFLLMGVAVAISKYFSYDLSAHKWFFRALANLCIIVVCLLLTIWLNSTLGFY